MAHELFTELDEICVKDGKDAEWKETARSGTLVAVSCRRRAGSGKTQTEQKKNKTKKTLFCLTSSPHRWLKFEEDVEDGGERWSKPYVATLSLHSLFELRSCIINGSVLLDMRATCIEEIAGDPCC